MHYSAISNRIILRHPRGPPQKLAKFSTLFMRLSVLLHETQQKTNLIQLTPYTCPDDRVMY